MAWAWLKTTFIDATRSTSVGIRQVVPVIYHSLWDVIFPYVNYAPLP